MTEPPTASVYHPTAPSTSFSRPCSKTTKNLFYWQVSEHTVRIISHCHYCPIQCWFVIPGPFSWQVLTCQMLAHSFRISIQIPMGWQRRFDRFFFLFCFGLISIGSLGWFASSLRFFLCLCGRGGWGKGLISLNQSRSINCKRRPERERERKREKQNRWRERHTGAARRWRHHRAALYWFTPSVCVKPFRFH